MWFWALEQMMPNFSEGGPLRAGSARGLLPAAGLLTSLLTGPVRGLNSPLSGGERQFYVLACESTCELHVVLSVLNNSFKKKSVKLRLAAVRTILKV